MLLNNRYRVLEPINNSGQSNKYVGQDNVTRAKVFIKATSYQGMGMSIEKEIYQQINHEQIPRLIDTFIEDEVEYLVLHWIEGESANSMISRGELSYVGLVHLFMQLCDVLTYLHGHPLGIVHRDINLSNMLISPYGRVYLIDFDISSCHALSKMDGNASGTIGYTAPETLLMPAFSGKQSDVYSLGACLKKALNQSPKVYSLELEMIAKKAMAIMPSDRYISIQQLREDLSLIV